MMQLKDKIDASAFRNKRNLTFKIILFVLQMALITAAFYVLFYLCIRLMVFSLMGGIPEKVMTVILTVIQLMSIVTCTVGLTRTLYMAEDNKVLLTLPVNGSMVFLSKLVLYYIFELRKNLTLTMPIFLAYGIASKAVWYYYPWMIVCFVFISLLPVAIGAVLSIPATFIANFIKRFKWLQIALTVVGAGLVIWGIFALIGILPEDINLIGRWKAISDAIQKFLTSFALTFLPFHWLNIMIVGGALRISAQLFNAKTFICFAVLLAVLAACIGLAFLVVRPLFVYMTSKQFEYEKRQVGAKRNAVHDKRSAMLFEDLKRNFRSSRYIITLAVQVFLPAIAVYFLNKLYAAMDTSYGGQLMTRAFSTLVLMTTLLAFNCQYAAVYSRDGNARLLLKTRPVNPIITLSSRLILRMTIIVVSSVLSTVFYSLVAHCSAGESVCIALTAIFIGVAHLLWCAEMDLMNPQSDQYATVGLEFDNPNERNATIFGFILSALIAGLCYLFSDRGIVMSYVEISLVAAAFLAVRAHLYAARIKLYYAEK